MAQLLADVLGSLDGQQKTLAVELFSSRTLEEGLTRLRRIRAVLGPSETLGGLDPDSAQELERSITQAIIDELSKDPINREPSLHIATWVSGSVYTRPVEIFTVNYDLLIEEAFEELGVPYFDGFVGNLRASFRADLVESRAGGEVLPPTFVRLWKLHGSLNWSQTPGRGVMGLHRVWLTPDL